MQKFAIALFLLFLPVLIWGAPQIAAKESTKKTNNVVVALTGIHSKTISIHKTHIFTTTAYAALKEIKGISVIPQPVIESLVLDIEEDNQESMEKAAQVLKADRIISFFIEQNNFEYTIAFYDIDGKTGEQKYTKTVKAEDSIAVVWIIRSIIAESRSSLEKEVAKKKVAKPVPGETTTPEVKFVKRENVKTGTDRINLEVSLYDFVDKNGGSLLKSSATFRLNNFLFAANYKIYAPSKKLAVTFGPFFSRAVDMNDLGLKISGFYYQSPEELFTIFASIAGAGGVTLKNSQFFASGEVKLGGVIYLKSVELFGEGGVGLRTGTTQLNMMINSGIRVYIF